MPNFFQRKRFFKYDLMIYTEVFLNIILYVFQYLVRAEHTAVFQTYRRLP